MGFNPAGKWVGVWDWKGEEEQPVFAQRRRGAGGGRNGGTTSVSSAEPRKLNRELEDWHLNIGYGLLNLGETGSWGRVGLGLQKADFVGRAYTKNQPQDYRQSVG